MDWDWNIDDKHIKFIHKTCIFHFIQREYLIPRNLKLKYKRSSTQIKYGDNDGNILNFNINVRINAHNKSITDVLLIINLPIVLANIILEYANLKEIVNLHLRYDKMRCDINTYQIHIAFCDKLINTDNFSYVWTSSCHYDFPDDYKCYFNLQFKDYLNQLHKTHSDEQIYNITMILYTICYYVDTVMASIFEKK